MEKPGSWRDIPTSLLHGGRSSRGLRVTTIVIIILVLVFVYGGSSSSSTTIATKGFSEDQKPSPTKPAAAPSDGGGDSSNSSGGGDSNSNNGSDNGGGESVTLSSLGQQQRIRDAAGNATLGFGSIQFINLPGRFDRLDAATLQAWVSGIDIIETRGVLAAEINDVGMPPEYKTELKTAEKGCWRAHANIWSQMLRDKTPAVLILESDAAWDVEVRASMSLLNEHFTKLLDTVQSKPLPNRSFLARQPPTSSSSSSSSSSFDRSAAAAAADAVAAAAAAAADAPPSSSSSSSSPPPAHPDDPWQSTHWDLLSLGQCWEDPTHKNISVRYPDPQVTPGIDYWGTTLGAERVVRRSGGIVCTTAYAVSQTGAAKLLLRSALDLDNPIDLVMRRLIRAGDLVAYSVSPTVFAQWEYLDNIGMRERGANSDIQTPDPDAEVDLSGWDTVKETGTVWRKKEGHPDIAFKDMALERAWALILGDDTTLERSQYNETEGN